VYCESWKNRENSVIIMNSLLKNALFRGITAILGDADGFVKLPVLSGPAKGLRFHLELVRRMESAYCKGTYDSAILERIRDLCSPGWTVWDCGVYLGYYSVFFSRIVGPRGNVVAVEPDPMNLARARRNAELNGCRNIRFVQAAISDQIGDVEFIINATSNSHLPETYVGRDVQEYRERVNQAGDSVSISSHTFDSLLEETGLAPDLIKIDIEGAEKKALFGAPLLVKEVRPLIVLELHNPECDAAAWDFGKIYGYQLEDIVSGRIMSQKKEVRGTLLCRPQ
jgi:FkbM family methyltransferase